MDVFDVGVGNEELAADRVAGLAGVLEWCADDEGQGEREGAGEEEGGEMHCGRLWWCVVEWRWTAELKE